ncbi:MAG: hypothetical protein K8S87_05550 [Planctomycetes bacterium]|nr:hypothetical protein [Planctomycetota bacterium]
MKRTVLTLLAIVLVFASYVSAETIKLADGTIIQGTVISGDEKGVEIKLIKNKAIVNFNWNQLSEKDRIEIRKRYGLEMPDYDLSITVIGDRIETFTGDAYVGKIESEDSTRVVMNWLNEDDEKVRKPIQRKHIRDIYRNIAIPAHIVMPKEEVYELILEKHPPVNAKDFYLLALYCKEIGFYEKGIEHLEDAVSMDPEMDLTCEELKVKLLKLISANEFRLSINDIQTMIKRKKLGEAYMRISELQNDKEINKDEDLKNIIAEINIEWELEATEFISKEWFKAIKNLASKKARDREINLNAARQYAYGQMDRDIQAIILDDLNKGLIFAEGVKSPIDAKLINTLFKKRDKKKYSPIKVVLNAEGFRIKLSGSSSNSKTANSSKDRVQQLKDLYEKYKSGKMSDEEKADFLKKYGKYLPGASRNRSIDPDDSEILKQARVDRNGRATRENPDTSRSGSPPSNNTPKPKKKLTIDEVWVKSSSTSRKAYIIYLYCKKKKEITLKTEKMKNTTYFAWFN